MLDKKYIFELGNGKYVTQTTKKKIIEFLNTIRNYESCITIDFYIDILNKRISRFERINLLQFIKQYVNYEYTQKNVVKKSMYKLPCDNQFVILSYLDNKALLNLCLAKMNADIFLLYNDFWSKKYRKQIPKQVKYFGIHYCLTKNERCNFCFDVCHNIYDDEIIFHFYGCYICKYCQNIYNLRVISYNEFINFGVTLNQIRDKNFMKFRSYVKYSNIMEIQKENAERKKYIDEYVDNKINNIFDTMNYIKKLKNDYVNQKKDIKQVDFLLDEISKMIDYKNIIFGDLSEKIEFIKNMKQYSIEKLLKKMSKDELIDKILFMENKLDTLNINKNDNRTFGIKISYLYNNITSDTLCVLK